MSHMINLGQHAAFIIAAYSAAAAIVAGLIAWVVLDHSAQKRQLEDLEKQGVARRSQGASN